MQPRVRIIIVNFNGYDDTIECVRSLLQISYTNYEIIVVDNGSTKSATFEQLEYLHKHTIFIVSNENTGFSGGNNIGINHRMPTNPDYFLLLNNDTIVKSDFLDMLVSDTHNCDGIIAGKIYLYDNPNRIWFAGGEFDWRRGVPAHAGWHMTDEELGSQDQTREISFATGCLMLIPINLIKRIGLLSDQYFLYAEDNDYCCRAIIAGYSIHYCKEAIIYHKVSSSTGALSDNTQYYMTRNNLILIKLYATDKIRAYAKAFWQMTKDIIRGRKKFKPVYWALVDYVLGHTGKNIHA
jgi:hypothetical protein